MKAQELYQKLADGELTVADVAKRAARKHELVPILMDGMGEKKADVKYRCAKVLRILVEEKPELLYPYFETFASMLDHSNKIFQWEAIYILAGLAGVDEDCKINGILDTYFARIEGPNMITAANIVSGAARIASAQPDLASHIVAEILRAERGRYESVECYEVVSGAVLKAFTKIYKWVDDPSPLVAFGKRHRVSTRPSTRKAAEALLLKHDRMSKRKKEKLAA